RESSGLHRHFGVHKVKPKTTAPPCIFSCEINGVFDVCVFLTRRNPVSMVRAALRCAWAAIATSRECREHERRARKRRLGQAANQRSRSPRESPAAEQSTPTRTPSGTPPAQRW